MRIASLPILSGGIYAPSDEEFFTSDAEKAAYFSVSDGFVKNIGTVSQADELVGFRTQPGGVVVQSNGLFTALSAYLPDSRVSIAQDPEDASKKCWSIRCSSGDADTAGTGAKRTEFSTSANTENSVVKGKEFLFCVANRLAESWYSTTDKQILWQVHSGASVSPPIALVVQSGNFVLDLRHGTTTGQTQVIIDGGDFGLAWNRWVVRGELHDSSGFLQCWRNGQLIVDYKGPLGYSDNALYGYIKSGIYHWTNGNPWDLSVPSRGIYQKGFWQVDPQAVTSLQLNNFVTGI